MSIAGTYLGMRPIRTDLGTGGERQHVRTFCHVSPINSRGVGLLAHTAREARLLMQRNPEQIALELSFRVRVRVPVKAG